MKIKNNFWDKGKIIERPTHVPKPSFRKGDEVEYIHEEHGKIKGVVDDVYILKERKGIFYDIDFPDKKLTVKEIHEDYLLGHSQKEIDVFV